MANGGQMTTAAFAQIPYIGPLILMVSIITFAYSTILGWSYYGERAAEYLLGKKAILPYKVLFIAVVVCAPVLALDLVWTIADVLNAFMAIPNLIAVLLLSGVIAAETKHYLKHLDERMSPRFRLSIGKSLKMENEIISFSIFRFAIRFRPPYVRMNNMDKCNSQVPSVISR